MVQAQTAFVIMSGMLSGFVAGYIVKYGADVREFYKGYLKMPNYILGFMEILTMFAVLLIYWMIIILLID